MRIIPSVFALAILATPVFCEPRSYIPNQQGNSISVIDTMTNTVVDTIDTDPSTPSEVGVSPDGGTLYVSSRGPGGVWELLVIDLAIGSVVAAPPIGSFAGGLALTPDGGRVYIAEQAPGTVSVLDAATNKIVDTIDTGGAPRAVVAHPDGSRIYAADLIGFVHEINVATGMVTDSIATPGGPFGIALHPILNRLYVTTDDGLTVIDLASNTLITSIPLGVSSIDVALTCDRAFVTDSVADTVSVIDLATNTVLTTVQMSGDSWGIDSHPNGSRVYAVNLSDDLVSVINTASLSVVTTVPVGNGPSGIGTFVAGSKNFSCEIFADGFESGDTSAWTSVVP